MIKSLDFIWRMMVSHCDVFTALGHDSKCVLGGCHGMESDSIVGAGDQKEHKESGKR